MGATQLAALIPILAMAVMFDAFCLYDLAHADRVRYLPPLAWAAIICLSTPLGGVTYLTLGRVR
jgi:hypothetical protein